MGPVRHLHLRRFSAVLRCIFSLFPASGKHTVQSRQSERRTSDARGSVAEIPALPSFPIGLSVKQ